MHNTTAQEQNKFVKAMYNKLRMHTFRWNIPIEHIADDFMCY